MINVSRMNLKNDHKNLTQWYKKNRRDLPWRRTKDPYQIWISEVMLQQTTVVAVIPYFEKFIRKFPTVHALAEAPESAVLESWAGLGYYSRARNLHKAAKAIASLPSFPQTAAELIELPGFGPYTSRAVASIAFQEKVGVLDGNVIRVLSRKHGLKLEWWGNTGRQKLQDLSDQLSQLGEPDVVNQALMELGATLCSPQKYLCTMCPWASSCVAFEKNKVAELPLKKPRKESEVWIWDVDLHVKNNRVALVQNDYAPFLKKQMIFPGKINISKNKPKNWDVKHAITHHDIYVNIKISKETSAKSKNVNLEWVEISNLKKINPSSLLQKVLNSIS